MIEEAKSGTAVELMMTNAIVRAIKLTAASQQLSQTPDELLTIEEAGRVLHLGRNKAYEFFATGAVPIIKLYGRKVRRRALEAWMEANEGMDLTDPLHPVPLQEEKAI